MEKNIETAVALVRKHREDEGRWPCLGSPFVESLPLTEAEISEALQRRALAVVFPPGGPAAYVMVP